MAGDAKFLRKTVLWRNFNQSLLGCDRRSLCIWKVTIKNKSKVSVKDEVCLKNVSSISWSLFSKIYCRENWCDLRLFLCKCRSPLEFLEVKTNSFANAQSSCLANFR